MSKHKVQFEILSFNDFLKFLTGTDAEGESDTSADILASLDKYEEELNPAALLTEKEIKKEPEDKNPKIVKSKEKPKPKSKQEAVTKVEKESKPVVKTAEKSEVKTADEKPEMKITKTGSSEKKRKKHRKLLFSSDEEESSNSDSEENITLKHKAKKSIEQISKKMFHPSSKMVKEALRQNKFGKPSLPIEDLQPPQNSTTARLSKVNLIISTIFFDNDLADAILEILLRRLQF